MYNYGNRITKKEHLMLFIKFGQKEHIEQLQKEGLIYMNTFDYFRECEDKEIGDSNENINYLFQADKSEVMIDNYKLTKENGLINLTINAPFMNNPFLTHGFCISCISKGDEIREDFKIFDDKVTDFGDTLLIIYNQKIFIERIEKALREIFEKNLAEYWQGNKVEYIDFNTYQGEIGPFRKSLLYKHQQEWRLGVRAKNHNHPFIFKIGSIEDISKIQSVEKFKNQIKENEKGHFNIYF